MKASELKPGMKVVLESGEVKRISTITRGWFTDSVMILWVGGWACVPNGDIIEVRQ
jgi:hypothetical protein